jgi:hypothetical protein
MGWFCFLFTDVKFSGAYNREPILSLFLVYFVNYSSKCIKNSRLHSTAAMGLDEMIRTIIKAGYEVRKNECLESG